MEHRPFPPDATKPPQSKLPWPLIALLVAVVLLVVTLTMVPKTNRAATKSMNNSPIDNQQLQLTAITLAPQEVNNLATVDVYGQATNTGRQPITNAIVSAEFDDNSGKPVLLQQQPMERVDSKSGDKAANPRELGNDPLHPAQSTGFRARFTDVPSTWNHQPPRVTVSQVTIPKP
jgi:hypothetical protein